jgi:hypothetical protein
MLTNVNMHMYMLMLMDVYIDTCIHIDISSSMHIPTYIYL